MKVFSSFKKPCRLKRGDIIGIVAPAWTFDRGNFIKGLKKLSGLGFKIKYEPTIFHKYWSMAGYDQERAEQINRMFADSQVKAIFCAKAGYGSLRTLPYLNEKVISKNPKIFVGYSDITILLSYLQKIGRMVVFHGPVVSGEICEGMNPITFKHLLRSIMQPYKLGQMKFNSLKSLRPGKANGILVGGNMSLIVSTIGTRYEINTDNRILFLEDVGEDLETIDNYLMHLKMAKKLTKVKGIVFGRMIGCVDHSGRKYTIRHILNDMLGDLNIPIIYGFPSGHRVFKDINITLPFGVPVTLDAYKTKLIINQAAVR